MNTILPVENNDVLPALRSFLKRLMNSGVIEVLLVPLEHGEGVMPALVTDPALLDSANPLMPLMSINNARAVSAITGKHTPAKIGVVLRPCEIRALIELVKLQQASLENLTIISMDCPGTYEIPDSMAKGTWKQASNLSAYLDAAKEGKEPDIDGLSLRQACQMCIHPVPENLDIHIHLFGVDVRRGLPVTMKDEIAAVLNLTEGEAGGGESVPFGHDISEAVARLMAGRQKVREEALGHIHQKMTSNDSIASLFASCIRCHNCMTACPICYCKTCLFKTAAFDHEPEYYLNAAHRKGATRMLGDTLLFHLTRLNHMGASCVSCGMCTSACPSDIPVGMIFSAVGEQVQRVFDYVPARM
ncbi:MAG: formate dehydrogenase [Chloroflexi bacterium]|nr:formate dehydrogenase [Chloroflexota bacterium]